MRILLIEDNRIIAQAVRTILEVRRFAVDVAFDGATGTDYLHRQVYESAIIDVTLPDIDGFSIVRNARSVGIQTPILMLTARDAVEDRVRGLECGADDYLIKPFEESELVARLSALVRRRERIFQALVQVGELTIDVAARIARVGEKSLELSSTEFRLLEYLARNAGITLSRTQLLESVWEYDFDGPSNVVDVYVGQLRKKLAKGGAPKLIHTVWGVGYRLEA